MTHLAPFFALVVGLVAGLPVLADDVPEPLDDMIAGDPNPVCSRDVMNGRRFDLGAIGPLIEGNWTETAPGVGYTTGTQTASVVITYNAMRDRLYLGDGTSSIELTPNFGAEKPMRWDYLRAEPLPAERWALDLEIEDMLLVADCEDLAFAPQFTWTVGSGARRSDGVLTFLTSGVAIGMKWNSAQGAREQLLQR